MFDAHRHFTTTEIAYQNALYATSSKIEWPFLHSLKEMAIGGIGLLPSQELGNIDELESLLKQQPELQIAEVGMDRRYPDIETQERFLLDVLSIAHTLGRSVTLHCVRLDGHLLNLLQDRKTSLPALLWHGFTGSLETARQAARLGVIISYGRTLFHSKLANQGAKLISFPYALETDFEGPDETMYEEILQKQVMMFSKITSSSVDTLIRNNDEIRTILTNNTSTR